MGKGDIRLSEKHGINPSLGVCFWCGKDDGTIVMPGRLPGDVEAPHRAVWTKDPCPECKKLMAQGVMLLEVRDGQPKSDNPDRTGRMWVIKDEAISRMFAGPMADHLLKIRGGFVEQAVTKTLGFPEPGAGEDR